MVAQNQEIIQAALQPVATGSSATVPIGVSPVNGVVDSVTWEPNATLTGAATNTRALSVVNKGPADAGTNVVATLQFNSGVNGTVDEAVTIPLSGTPANLVVAVGDVLVFTSAAVGTGLADPGGLVTVTLSRTQQQD